MKRIMILVIGLLALAFGIVRIVSASNESDLVKIKAATAKYQSLVVAEADGYGLIPGLDHCFENPGVGAMGYHYIDAQSLDTSLDLLKPESMVYHSGANGQLKLGAVEYIVPLAKWEAEGRTGVPSLLGQNLHLNENLGVYVLHAWVWLDNPTGVYKDWNPQVTCP